MYGWWFKTQSFQHCGTVLYFTVLSTYGTVKTFSSCLVRTCLYISTVFLILKQSQSSCFIAKVPEPIPSRLSLCFSVSKLSAFLSFLLQTLILFLSFRAFAPFFQPLFIGCGWSMIWNVLWSQIVGFIDCEIWLKITSSFAAAIMKA